jgi:hypothetical protein
MAAAGRGDSATGTEPGLQVRFNLFLDTGMVPVDSNAGSAYRRSGTMSFGSDTVNPPETIRSRDWPTIRQFAVFVENRVGQLLEIVRLFEGTNVRVIAISMVDSVDCAIVRMVLSHPEQGLELLRRAGFAVAESDLVGVQLPHVDQPILQVCSALLQAEINIHYAYPLLVHPRNRTVLALHVDSTESAMQTLRQKGFTILAEKDLTDEEI